MIFHMDPMFVVAIFVDALFVDVFSRDVILLIFWTKILNKKSVFMM